MSAREDRLMLNSRGGDGGGDVSDGNGNGMSGNADENWDGEDSPTTQLCGELEEDVKRVRGEDEVLGEGDGKGVEKGKGKGSEGSEGRRPIITHLNADTSWLFSIPLPIPLPNPVPVTKTSSSGSMGRGRREAKDEMKSEGGWKSEGGGKTQTKEPTKKKYFHILIDPWFHGPQSDITPLFSQQWHVEESFVQSIEEVSRLIRRIEDEESPIRDSDQGTFAKGSIYTYSRTEGEGKEEGGGKVQGGMDTDIDLILISHEFTDHMHKETLLEASPTIPVLATDKAAGIMRSWGYFESVGVVGGFEGDWRGGKVEGVPSWLGVSRVKYPGMDLLYYHSALMVCFPANFDTLNENENGDGNGNHTEKTQAEAILYTPHGITPSNLSPLLSASPKISILALLHGLTDIKLGLGFQSFMSIFSAQLNLGARNGVRVCRMLGVRYWVGTHDERKRGGGVVGWFLRRGVGEVVWGGVRFLEVGNGGFLVLR